ncbi:hypothetical protein M5K25_028178 [Dendrobium thyrsiflorum]|uniref:Uncharacterized protein n=1 Tax=Dendrobium thyrsiflorum TaxID=117978 RepID=A0ABD0TW01_DENTH
MCVGYWSLRVSFSCGKNKQWRSGGVRSLYELGLVRSGRRWCRLLAGGAMVGRKGQWRSGCLRLSGTVRLGLACGTRRRWEEETREALAGDRDFGAGIGFAEVLAWGRPNERSRRLHLACVLRTGMEAYSRLLRDLRDSSKICAEPSTQTKFPGFLVGFREIRAALRLIRGACIVANDKLLVLGDQEGDFMAKPSLPFFRCVRSEILDYFSQSIDIDPSSPREYLSKRSSSSYSSFAWHADVLKRMLQTSHPTKLS